MESTEPHEFIVQPRPRENLRQQQHAKVLRDAADDLTTGSSLPFGKQKAIENRKLMLI